MVPTSWGLCSVNWCCKEQQRGAFWQAWSQGAWLKLLTLVMVIGAKAFSILMMVASPCWWVRGSSEYETDLQTNDRMAWRSGKWCRTLALPYIVTHDNEGIHQGSIVKLLFQFSLSACYSEIPTIDTSWLLPSTVHYSFKSSHFVLLVLAVLHYWTGLDVNCWSPGLKPSNVEALWAMA